ncbi:MAG: ATP-binding protein [Succinivibrio dextrinosolvens]|nr:ATP-binding protein [Succinivibrio dextrinosolvens]
MSTEICVNYSDEISRYNDCFSDENKSYSNRDVHEKALLKETLSGNVKKEYDFAMSGIFYGSGKLKNSLGDAEYARKEALLDHSAIAQVPYALVQGAFINYFGGYATVPNRKKAFSYAAKACLQGNYNAVGLFQDDMPSVLHPLIAVYKLEFFINPIARSLYSSFYRAFHGRVFDRVELSASQYESFYRYSMEKTKDNISVHLFLRSNLRLIIKTASAFALGCMCKIQNGLTPDEEDTIEFLHFMKCLHLIDEIKRALDRNPRPKYIVGTLNMLLKEVKDPYDNNAYSRIAFDRGTEILITRLFLENYSLLVYGNDCEALKALADRIIPELESDHEVTPYQNSPYVLRVIGLYELYLRNSEIHQRLKKALDNCTVPEFYRIACALELEKLLVASLSDSSKKYNGETVWVSHSDGLSYNREKFASYLSDAYAELVSCLTRICDCVNIQSQFPDIYRHCHEDCVSFIRSYLALDPVLAYNDCEYSKKLSAFINYAVDRLSLPPHKLADIKKTVPFYGYTRTGAVGLYLLDKRGKHCDEVSALNKTEQELAVLRQQILEQDLNSIVTAFTLQKDNSSENYDYLLKELLHKLICLDLSIFPYDTKKKELFSCTLSLLKLLLARAQSQTEQGMGGIASECLSDLILNRYLKANLSILAMRFGCSEDYEKVEESLADFKPLKTCRYPRNNDDASVIVGDCRDFAPYALNKAMSLFDYVKHMMRDGVVADNLKPDLKQGLTHYYRFILAYNLCNPLRENSILLKRFEAGFIKRPRSEIYPKSEFENNGPKDSDSRVVKIPFISVNDPDAREDKDSDKGASKDSDRRKEDMKELDFEKETDKKSESADNENISPKHYELKNADKPLHITGNRKLSEIFNERIIKALKTDPEKMKKYGMNIVPNFILYGEPGCGKTEAVRQYCEHLGLEPVIINSATVGTSRIHETPVNIHEKFDEAIKKKNGVIIIDEADAFLSERDNLRTDDDFKTEEVSAALQGIDQSNRNHTQVIVMTNKPDKIDKAILRDGRLGIHIEIKNPDETDLEEIIETFFEKSELEQLDKTQMVKALNGQTIASVYSILNGIRVDMVMNNADLSHQYVMEKINTALGYTLKRGAHFSLPGQQEFEDYVNKNIVHHLINPDLYRKYNLKFPNSILLYGPTGTGKTYAAKKLAEFLGWNFRKLDSMSIGSESVQGSAIKIAKVFDRARREAPCIIFIDEIDAWLPKRSGCSSSSEISQVNEFLDNMSTVNSDNLLLIGTTNRIDDIDEAALRPGRFSTKIEIGYMKGEQVEELLHSLIKDIPYDESIDLSEIARTQDNRSVADIVAFFEKACRFSAENEYELLTEECFQKAMDTETKQDENRRIGFL